MLLAILTQQVTFFSHVCITAVLQLQSGKLSLLFFTWWTDLLLTERTFFRDSQSRIHFFETIPFIFSLKAWEPHCLVWMKSYFRTSDGIQWFFPVSTKTSACTSSPPHPQICYGGSPSLPDENAGHWRHTGRREKEGPICRQKACMQSTEIIHCDIMHFMAYEAEEEMFPGTENNSKCTEWRDYNNLLCTSNHRNFSGVEWRTLYREYLAWFIGLLSCASSKVTVLRCNPCIQ